MSLPPIDKRWCSGCEYSEPVHLPEGMLRCRRYAPRPVPGGEEPTGISWPLVNPEDWCGEFLEREPGEDEGIDVGGVRFDPT